MTPFQWIACSSLALVLIWELLRLRRGGQVWGAWLLRSLVWLGALVTIADPEITTRVAHALGISRGADVVFYLFVLAFLATSFHFTTQNARLQRQLNALVSHLAIRDARRGTAPAEGPKAPPAP
jgi:hypothetical protein